MAQLNPTHLDVGLLGEKAPSQARSPAHAALSPRHDIWRPRYSLSALLWVITLLCVLFAVMRVVGAIWSVALGLLALLIAGHIAGAIIGSRLRNGTTRQILAERQRARESGLEERFPPSGKVIQTPHHLQQRTSLGWTVPITAAVGALLFAIFGGVLLSWIVAPSQTWIAIGFGSISFAVLGGFAGFLASSLWRVFRSAWREAAE